MGTLKIQPEAPTVSMKQSPPQTYPPGKLSIPAPKGSTSCWVSTWSLGSNPGTSACSLCDPGQVTSAAALFPHLHNRAKLKVIVRTAGWQCAWPVLVSDKRLHHYPSRWGQLKKGLSALMLEKRWGHRDGT